MIENLVKDLKPVKPLAKPMVRFFRWFIFALVIISVAMALLGIRHDLNQMISDPRFLFETILLFLIALSSSIAAFHLAIPAEERKLNLPLLVTPLILWGIELIVILVMAKEMPISPGWSCTSSIVLMGLPSALLLYFMIQKASPVYPRWTGWFALIAAFSLSAFTEQFTCHNNEPVHLLLWHFLPVVLLGSIEMLIFRSKN